MVLVCDALVILYVLSGFAVILLVMRVGGESWLLCFHSVLAFVCLHSSASFSLCHGLVCDCPEVIKLFFMLS